MICNMLGCNSEAFTQVMFYYFEDSMKKPFCKEIMRFCINHAKMISKENTSIRIQIMN